MYPYQYPWQSAYKPNNMIYGGYAMPCYQPNYTGGYRIEENEEEQNFEGALQDTVLAEETRVEKPAAPPVGMQMPMQQGMGSAAQPVPAMPMQPGMMMPGMMQQPAMMAPSTMQQDTFSVVLKQIQVESPQILSALITLGMSIENLRQIIMRIVEAANKDQK